MKRTTHIALISLLSCLACGENSPSTLNEDINPTGNFGILSILSPDVGNFDAGQYEIILTRKDNGSKPYTWAFDNEIKLEANIEYCVRINAKSKESYVNTCEVTLAKGDKDTLKTGLVSLVLDTESVDVDIGPRPALSLRSEKQSISLKNATMYPDGWLAQTPILLAFSTHLNNSEQTLVAEYRSVDILKEDSTQYKMNSEDIGVFDISPKDRRATLVLKAPLAKYPKPDFPSNKGSYESSYAYIAEMTLDSSFAAPLDFEVRDSVRDIATPEYGSRYFKNWLKIPLHKTDRAEQMTYHMYPLAGYEKDTKTTFYQVRVSGLRKNIFFAMKDKQKTAVNLEPLNVTHVNGTVPGFYKLYDISNEKDIRPMAWVSNYDGYAHSSSVMPKYGEQYGDYFPTQSTMYVLKGFKYRLISYIYDDTQALTTQSIHDLDYLDK